MLVPINAGTSPTTGDIGDLLNYTLNWVESGPYNKHLALLGEYGQGKSIFATTLALELLRRFDEFKRVPILIELGGKSPRTAKLPGLLRDWAGAYHVGGSAQAWLEAGRAVLIFDAFDEMDLVGDRTLRLQSFLSLWEGTWHPGTRIIITGRPNLFLDTDEMREALRIAPEGSLDHHAQPVYLQKFDRRQIEEALATWPDSIRRGILTAYDRGEGLGTFRELIERPATLALAASVWPSIEAEVEAGRVGNSAIIRQFLYATYSRQREKREREGAEPLLTTSELAFFMRATAAFMAAHHGATNRITRSELADLVGRLLESWPSSLANLGGLPTEQQPDREGMDLADWAKGNPHRAEAIQHEVAATGILVDDPTDQAFLRMAHKSFFEYLTAEVLTTLKFPNRFAAVSESPAYEAIKARDIASSMSRESLIFAADVIYNGGLMSEFRIHDNPLQTTMLKMPLFRFFKINLYILFPSFIFFILSFFSILIYIGVSLSLEIPGEDAGDTYMFGGLSIAIAISFLCFLISLLVTSGLRLILLHSLALNNMCRLRILLAILYETSLDNLNQEIHLDNIANELLEDFVGVDVRGHRATNTIPRGWKSRANSQMLAVLRAAKPSKFRYFDTDVSADVATLYLAQVDGDNVEIIRKCSSRAEVEAAMADDPVLGPYVIYH